jgi:hypothetical protein
MKLGTQRPTQAEELRRCLMAGCATAPTPAARMGPGKAQLALKRIEYDADLEAKMSHPSHTRALLGLGSMGPS